MSHTLQHCPRCNQDWTKPSFHYECKTCSLEYLRYADILYYKVERFIEVSWQCNIGICGLVANGHYSQIPWLPYTVSKDDVLKLMVLL